MKVAIFIDGQFFTKAFRAVRASFPRPEDVMALTQELLSDEEFADCDLYRVFFYDCPPFHESITHPSSGERINMSETPSFMAITGYLKSVAGLPKVAFRAGSLYHTGWAIPQDKVRRMNSDAVFTAEDFEPAFTPKQSFVKMGLDMVGTAQRRLADKLILVSPELDLVPALKEARREGAQVFLGTFGRFPRPDMKEHSDGVVDVNLEAL